MKMKVIKKTDLSKLLNAVIENNDAFYGPVKTEGFTKIQKLNSHSEIYFNYNNTKLPVKIFFMPESEVLFAFKDNGNSHTNTIIIEEKINNQKKVIFGLRPCDAVSLNYLDKVFTSEKYTDPYFKNKKENIILISLACKELNETCFCTSVGGSPVSEKGSDILCYDLNNYLLFKGFSTKGISFLETFSSLFSEPDKAIIDAVKEFNKNAEDNGKSLSTSNLEEKLDNISSFSSFWENISRKCLKCGICTYLCPTCHCFSIHDENIGKTTSRMRIQDSCMYSNFSLEASGHNPREKKALRMRQRIMHKFSYAKKNYGETYCVGCGRCIESCPVNIDVREIITEATK